MKLVKAKCPSCGASIDVDANSDKTKCDFCNSPVIVENAIKCLEADIEIENHSELNALLKEANKNYKNGKYDEAYTSYCKVLELKPDVPEAVLRKGFCKFFESNYSNANINVVLTAIQDVCEMPGFDTNKLYTYIDEAFSFVNKYEMLINAVFEEKTLYLNDVKKQQDKLISCLELYEYLYDVSNDKYQKSDIIKKIIDTCESVNKSREYVNDEGNIEKFNESIQDISKKKSKYYRILNGEKHQEIKSELKEKNNVKIENTLLKENSYTIERKVELEKKNEINNKIISYLIYALGVFLIILSFIMYLSKFYLLKDCIISWIIGFGIVIFNLPNISKKLFKLDKYRYMLVLFLFIVWLIFLFNKYII